MSTDTTTQAADVLVAGQWRPADATGTFTAANPATGEALGDTFPVSAWSDIDAALDAAVEAFEVMRTLERSQIAGFLRAYADGIEANGDAICASAALETGLPIDPRLKTIELGRTVGQQRQAADACEDESWRMATIDAAINLRSVLEAIGPVAVFGPNNFPLAFNGVSGGDFAAAIAAGCPVIAKAHPLHPETSRLIARCASDAIAATGMPAATVQMVYAMSNDDGLRLVSDARLGSVGFTGSRKGGTALKASADAVGKPIYLEMSSVNPVVILPGAMAERCDDLIGEMATSGLMAAGQFCTSPGLIVLQPSDETERFIAEVAGKYAESPCGTLLGEGVMQGLAAGVDALKSTGATVVTGDGAADRAGFARANTLMRIDGSAYLAAPQALQEEAFGNATLVVVADDTAQVRDILATLEGNLTGSIYSAADGSDDSAYDTLAPVLRLKVGRLINDKMPTGVAVSPAMNHGGPFPATGHPHFTAVGIPAAMRRFTMLACYDNVRPHRLPAILQDPA